MAAEHRGASLDRSGVFLMQNSAFLAVMRSRARAEQESAARGG